MAILRFSRASSLCTGLVAVTGVLIPPAASAAPQSGPTLQVLETCGAHGDFPDAALLQGGDGRIYGTCQQGGAHGGGTVFVMDTDGANPAVVFDFDGAAGGFEPTGVIQGSDGLLYGTTEYGGANGFGIVYRVHTDGSGFEVLYDLDNTTTGAYPLATLIQASDGLLYGTTYSGGANNAGTVFQLATDGSFFNVILDFDGANTGAEPLGALIEGAGGVLYGTTVWGGTGSGVVFKLSPPSGHRFYWSCLRLVDFDGGSMGYGPNSTLLQASDGALYGTTYSAGANGLGTIFKVQPDGTGFAVLQNLFGTIGSGGSKGPMVERADGKLYGTLSYDGAHGAGTAFKMQKDGNGFEVLYDFDYYGVSAGYPNGLIVASDGNLYGSTLWGDPGAGVRAGVVYRLDYLASWTNYGSGLAGKLGVPGFVANSNPLLGKKLSLTVDNSRGVATGATLFIGLSRASIPVKGGTLLVGSTLLLDTFVMPAPSLTIDGDLPSDPALAGFVLDLQVIEADPAAAKGLSFTPGLELVLGW
jgi:uncharacterized repeat protein (TIGR03803 family)